MKIKHFTVRGSLLCFLVSLLSSLDADEKNYLKKIEIRNSEKKIIEFGHKKATRRNTKRYCLFRTGFLVCLVFYFILLPFCISLVLLFIFFHCALVNFLSSLYFCRVRLTI